MCGFFNKYCSSSPVKRFEVVPLPNEKSVIYFLKIYLLTVRGV